MSPEESVLQIIDENGGELSYEDAKRELYQKFENEDDPPLHFIPQRGGESFRSEGFNDAVTHCEAAGWLTVGGLGLLLTDKGRQKVSDH